MNASGMSAVIIGGGFYGCALAHYLKTKRGFASVTLVERERALMMRASYHNQARVHNGYHYPRSLTTALRSRVNLPRFVQDYPETVARNFTKLYAIPRQSKVTARQFTRFCRGIGASLSPAPPALKRLFSSRLVEEVFLAEEYAFDATALRARMEKELGEAGVVVRLGSRVTHIEAGQDRLGFTLDSGDALAASYGFNCTYSGLNQFGGSFSPTASRLKHEVTEMALLDMPEPLKELGITVMDGPFFSAMPFPARGLHSFSHVRYTPHLPFADAGGSDPYATLAAYPRESRVERMLRDAARYLPIIAQAQYRDSLFEVKTVLVKNESDDGRPILFERHANLPRLYSVLGGKIDNIYDMLERFDGEVFS